MSTNQSHRGRYELQERLGRSVVGEIWKAFDPQERRYVAIKIIPVNAQTNTDFAPRFYHEAQILAALRHPNIVPIRDFRIEQSGSEAYIIMDYVEGPSLADHLSSTARMGKILPPTEFVHLMIPIAAALDYAHQRNVIHGALRPAAILLGQLSETSSSPWEPKLTDFGLNHIQNPLALPLDDVHYISPEIAQGFAGTNRSDLYSLGVMLYEMCTGALPFYGDTASDILMQHIHGMPISPALINPHILPALTAAIMRSLARDPAARYPSATAMVATIAKILNIPMPDSISHSHLLPGTANPPSLSGISDSLDMMNSPTYLSQQSLSNASSVPPVVGGSNTPVLPPPPVISSSTPVLSVAPTGQIPVLQTPAEKYTPTAQISPSPFAASASTRVPTTFPGPSVPPQAPRQTGPSPTSAPPVRRRRPGWLYIALIALLLVVLASSALGAYLLNTRSTTTPPSPIIGHTYFKSSGLLGNLNSNQGISDELEINLQNLPAPRSGNSYYAWLLDDNQTNLPAVALGPLTLSHGLVTQTYIDPQHNNLLANYGHFLVTEENSNPAPITPSLDSTTWRYSSVFPTTPNPADTVNHFSVLDHLRHLLAQDPKLKKYANLGGGLDIWLFRNVTKVLEQAGSARDMQKQCTPAPNNPNCAFVDRALVRVLDFLDGSTYVQQDVPAGTKVYIDPTVARVALLEFDPVHQEPPGYLDHIATHLRELAGSPGITATQRTLAIQIGLAINNVQGWLEAVRTDAVQLVHMNNSQLSQLAALAIFNDMLTKAKYALVGQFDPNTVTVKQGVAQIHENLQGLATFDVTPCTITNGKNSCA